MNSFILLHTCTEETCHKEKPNIVSTAMLIYRVPIINDSTPGKPLDNARNTHNILHHQRIFASKGESHRKKKFPFNIIVLIRILIR